MATKRKQPKRRNPAARALAERRHQPRVVPPAKRYRRERKIPSESE